MPENPEDRVYGASLRAAGGQINFYPAGLKYNEQTDDKAAIKIGQGAGIMSVAPNNKPGLVMRDTVEDSSLTEISSEGVWSNGGNMSFIAGIAGIKSNATIAAELNDRNDDPNGYSAAVYAVDNTNAAKGPSRSYGVITNTLWSWGASLLGALMLGAKITHEDYTCGPGDTVVMCYNSIEEGVANITMPTVPDAGQGLYGARVVIVRRVNPGGVLLLPDGSHNFAFPGGSGNSFAITNPGNMVIAIWDGSHWHLSQI